LPGDPLADLPKKDRFPKSARILDGWVRDAQKLIGSRGERVGWILASTIVAAALQRELHNGTPVFLLKGGVFIERALDLNARATKDLDTLYRGAEADLIAHIDRALAEPWGEITFSRTPIEIIEKAKRVIKPRRFRVQLDIRGVRWRSIQVEASFAEGGSGHHTELLPAPSTRFFGIDRPDEIVTIAMGYQVAQKLHACTDPDDPPEFVNDRVRDIVDLLLIRDAFYPEASDLKSVCAACEDVFASRVDEAEQLGHEPRHWPPVVVANDVWRSTWHIPAGQVGMGFTLDPWLDRLVLSAAVHGVTLCRASQSVRYQPRAAVLPVGSAVLADVRRSLLGLLDQFLELVVAVTVPPAGVGVVAESAVLLLDLVQRVLGAQGREPDECRGIFAGVLWRMDRVEEALVIQRDLPELGHRGDDVGVFEVATHGLLGECANSRAHSIPLRALRFAELVIAWHAFDGAGGERLAHPDFRRRPS
jgi:hypothetical protein